MATDKKSDFYTTAKNYTDLNGQLRSFDIIDHDIKTKIATSAVDGEKAKEELKTYREKIVEKILALPASICPDVFQDFTVRGDYVKGIQWNEKMLSDPGFSIDKLVQLHTLLSNRFEMLP